MHGSEIFPNGPKTQTKLLPVFMGYLETKTLARDDLLYNKKSGLPAYNVAVGFFLPNLSSCDSYAKSRVITGSNFIYLLL